MPKVIPRDGLTGKAAGEEHRLFNQQHPWASVSVAALARRAVEPLATRSG